jgi:small GTP-binding protein
MERMKIFIIGEQSVGKSTILEMFIRESFEIEKNYDEVNRKKIKVNDKEFLLDILDNYGKSEYQTLIEMSIKYTDGFLFVYSITDKKSFQKLDLLYDRVMKIVI